jgi:MFS family permease
VKDVNTKSTRWLGPAAYGVIVATFLSDVGHEMATAVIPMYFASIGLGATALGAMEGAADLILSLAKIAGGVVGHRIKRKREVAAIGYAVTAIGTASMGLARAPAMLGVLRAGAWVGRGFRAPLRDYLLSASVAKTHYGRAYGIERTADMLGAVAGPAFALAFVALGISYHSIMLASFGPAIGAAASILFLAKQPPAESARSAESAHSRSGASPPTPRALAPPASQSDARTDYKLPPAFYRFVIGVALFGMGDFSRSLLILLAARAFSSHGATLGVSPGTLAVSLYAAHNVVSAIAAFPAGRYADRFSKKSVLLVGYALGVVTNGLLFVAGETALGIVCAVVLSGVYIAIEETVEKAAVASALPDEKRTLGFGVLATANAVGDMASSIYVGVLLDSTHPSWAFLVAAIFGTVGITWIALFTRAEKKEDA